MDEPLIGFWDFTSASSLLVNPQMVMGLAVDAMPVVVVDRDIVIILTIISLSVFAIRAIIGQFGAVAACLVRIVVQSALRGLKKQLSRRWVVELAMHARKSGRRKIVSADRG